MQRPDHELRTAGLRVTRPRVAVLRALQERPHSTPAQVIATIRAHRVPVSHQAVYDCLAALTGAGLVRCIEPAGSVARYELQSGDNHHHLVCRGCGGLWDVDCEVGRPACLELPRLPGFRVEEAEVIFWGTCPGCASSDVSEPTSPAGREERR